MTAAILNLNKETTEYRDFTGWNLEPQGLMEQELAHSGRRQYLERCCPNKDGRNSTGFHLPSALPSPAGFPLAKAS